MSSSRVVLMLGTSLTARGGIALSERLILEGWNNRSFRMELLVTHRDGSTLTKLSAFFAALAIFSYRLFFTDVSIVYAHFSLRASFYRKSIFVLLAKMFRKKIVLHNRTGEFQVFYREAPWIVQQYIVHILNMADAIIVLGRSEREFFTSLCDVAVCRVIHNSIVCPSSFSRLDRSPMVVSTMGTLGQRKGTYDLLTAIPQILEEFPETQFWLCGNGELEKCRAIIDSKRLSSSVKLLGWVSGGGKEEIYLNSSVYVLPSYYEGMPRSLLEAMSYGIPVVATCVNGIPDLVTHDETGLLIRPGDVSALGATVVVLLRDLQLRQRLGQAARNVVSTRFGVQEKLDELQEVFEAVISS